MEQLTLPTKKCNRCGVEKPVSEFSVRKASSDGLQQYCKECCRELAKKRQKSCDGLNPDLEPFSPRQLIEELRARGYKGELRYTHVIKV